MGHSCGGAVISQAAPAVKDVAGLVSLAAFGLDAGESGSGVQEPLPAHRGDRPRSPLTSDYFPAALTEWAGRRGERFGDLKSIERPALVVNGHHDIMLPTINSYILSQHIPNARLVVYPDSGHGSLFQYPRLSVDEVSRRCGVHRPGGMGKRAGCVRCDANVRKVGPDHQP